MQRQLIQILPASLTSRLDPTDDPQDVIFPTHKSSNNLTTEPDESRTAEAEQRMQKAYAEGGIAGFGQQMWTEFEREWSGSRQAKERRPAGLQDGLDPEAKPAS